MTNTLTVTKPRRGRPPKAGRSKGTDWEKLAKRLQEALESSFNDNKMLVQDKAKIVRMAHELEKQVVGLEAVVKLLEEKLDRAHYPV